LTRILFRQRELFVSSGGLDALLIPVRKDQLFASSQEGASPGPTCEGVGSRHEIMTATEVADYLRVPLKSLYTWRYTHEGPPSARVGKYLRYRRTDIDEWLDTQMRFNRRDGRELRAMPRRD
jgi:predicted DNA-binding transcriptional regulator AlpA